MSNFSIITLLKSAVANKISDIHIKINEPPAVRKDGKIIRTNLPPITEEDFFQTVELVIPTSFRNKAYDTFDADFSYDLPGVSRFRINLSRELGKMFMVIRVISLQIPTVEELNLPKSIEKFTMFGNGIVLVTGATGSGKSSTLAAMINNINNTQEKHIITIEDPVEYLFTPNKCIITQRQLEIDTPSFPEGVKYALRQDPDVILVGEIRDLDTMTAALKAAETGHLVLATMHTNDAIQTINRMLGFYEPKDRESIKKQIAEALRGTIAQRLIPRIDKPGRIPACEILVNTPTVKDFILRDSLEQIYDLVKKGNFNEMISLNTSLFNLYKSGIISKENALFFSDNKIELQQYMRGAFHGTSFDV
ncbi:MAG: PilT/PilU family type 4a pilus ATPase [Candidatus Gastranaerophilales bacterium]|nr:PilT/PilU family type 4a pilus ATPase [Candidatus Gastranaerophilales bacterium]